MSNQDLTIQGHTQRWVQETERGKIKQNDNKGNYQKKATRPTSPVISLSVKGEEKGKGSQYFI